MSTQTDSRPLGRTAKLIDDVLQHMEEHGELIAGARRQLLTKAADYPTRSEAAGGLYGYLGGRGAAYLSPEGRRQLRDLTPVEWVLERIPLRTIEARVVTAEWPGEFADLGSGFEPGELDHKADAVAARAAQVRAVIERIDDRHSELWNDYQPPIVDRKAREVLAALQADGYIASGADIDALVTKNLDLGRIPRDRAAQRMIKRLQTDPALAALACPGGRLPEVDWSDACFEPEKFPEDTAGVAYW